MSDNRTSEGQVEDRSSIVRPALITRAEMDGDGEDKRKRFTVVAATGEPKLVYGVDERLSMKKSAVDMSRLRNDAPFLADHVNAIDHILGKVENPRIEDEKLMVDVVLADNERAAEYAKQVEDGMANKVSVGFKVYKWKETRPYDANTGMRPEVTAMRWMPFEVSAVAVPVDDGAELRHRTLKHIGVETMPDETKETEAKQDPVPETQTRGENTQPAAAAPVAQVTATNNAAEVLAMGQAYEKRGVEGSLAKAHDAIAHNRGADWLRSEIEGLMDARVEALSADASKRQEDLKVGLSDKENRSFSLTKLTRAMSYPQNRAFQLEAGMELEASLEARKRNQAVDGYKGTSDHSLPQEFYEQPIVRTRAQAAWLAGQIRQRAVNVGLGGVVASGGADQLVETMLASGSFIEYLYNMSLLAGRVMQLPALSGNVDIPRRKTPVNVSWVEESKSGGYGEVDGDFDQVTLSPHKLFVATDISHTAMLQTDPGIEMLMRSDQAMQKALKLDAGGLNGAGTGNEVRGILHTSDIVSVTGSDTDGIEPTYALVLAVLGEVGAANGIMGDTMIATDWKMRFKMQGISNDAGSGKFLWDIDNDRVAGFPAVASNQMPRATRGGSGANGASTLLVFSPSNVIMGSWGTDDVQVDPYTKRSQGYVTLSCFSHHDFVVRQPKTVGSRPHFLN